MSISKRDFLALGAAAGASMALPAWAQGKPLFDTLNMFVPAAPGGGWDGTARAIERAAKAAGLVGNMAFENVGGAGGMVGLPRFVNQRKGQGNSLMVGGSVMIGAGSAIPAAARGSGHEHVERVEQGFALGPSGQGHGSTSGSTEGQEVAFGNGHACLLCEMKNATD